MTPAVSIIIPVLNGEQYIGKCMKFLKQQTFKNFETVFVIDSKCSDRSIEIAREFEKQLPNTRVIVQNSGYRQGGNRNIGLDATSGELVWFLDVDDAPSNDFLEEMTEILYGTNSDFVCCNFINTSPEGTLKEKKNKSYPLEIMDNKDAINTCIYGGIPIAPWSKLFRRSFLLENDIRFLDIGAEDVLFTYKCIKYCKKICMYNRPLYAYRQTYNSVCRMTANLNLRGEEEILAYDRVDRIFENCPEVLKNSALMKARSSVHMQYKKYKEYAKSDKNKQSYNSYLKGCREAWWNYHLPLSYYLTVRLYIILIYKRNGSIGVRRKPNTKFIYTKGMDFSKIN